MASREIKHLSPQMQILYNRFHDRCRRDTELTSKGISVLLTCTWRSAEEQDRLYAKGRTAPGAIVTNAKGGYSAHNAILPNGTPAARAFDIVPLRHGKPVWGTTGEDLAVWNRIGEHGTAVGLTWYGSPTSKFREFPHFQGRV